MAERNQQLRTLETDYLVVGAGATGVAFADEIILGSQDTEVILVDRREKPGGHWNDECFNEPDPCLIFCSLCICRICIFI